MDFPAVKAKRMRKLLEREPLCYREERCSGSHRRFESDNGYPPVGFWAHDKDELKPSVVREILLRQVGLTEEEARKLI